jgi:hypothetical protein
MPLRSRPRLLNQVVDVSEDVGAHKKRPVVVAGVKAGHKKREGRDEVGAGESFEADNRKRRLGAVLGHSLEQPGQVVLLRRGHGFGPRGIGWDREEQ